MMPAPVAPAPSGQAGGGRPSSSALRKVGLLLRKNVAVLRRNAFAASLPLLIPMTMILIVFLVGVDDRFNRRGYNKDTFNTPRSTSVPIASQLPLCDPIRMPGCTTPLAFVGTMTPDAREVHDSILAANTHLDPDSVRHFDESEDLNHELLTAPYSILTAVHFCARQSPLALAHSQHALTATCPGRVRPLTPGARCVAVQTISRSCTPSTPCSTTRRAPAFSAPSCATTR